MLQIYAQFVYNKKKQGTVYKDFFVNTQIFFKWYEESNLMNLEMWRIYPFPILDNYTTSWNPKVYVNQIFLTHSFAIFMMQLE